MTGILHNATVMLAIVIIGAFVCYADEPPHTTGIVGGLKEAGVVEVILTSDGRQAPYAVPAGMLDPEGVRITLNDSQLQVGQYNLDAAAGLLYLSPYPPSGTIIKVHYRLLLQTQAGVATTQRYTPTGYEEPSETGLMVTGSKSITVRSGTGQNLGLDQTLDLAISGKAAEDLTLEGHLSDQNTPVEPEGTTEQLSSLDRIYLKASGNRWSVTLGDIDVGSDRGNFLPFSRKTLGIVGNTDQDTVEGTGFLAANRGRAATCRFTTSEGIQGPYFLTVAGEVDITVIPGSERVTVDGNTMRRGEGNDYTIDYTAPSITFTFHRPVHSGMQVLVEFEFSNRAYQRTLTGVDSVIRSSDDFLTVGVAGVREEDSRYNDMLGLTDADRLRLERAGDASSGYYRQRRDGLGHLLYRFVGMGNGAYIRQYNPITNDYDYIYVGTGKGDYAPYEELIPAPNRRSLADLAVKVGRPILNVETEYALSENDLNLFSPLDEGDNLGQAYSGKVQSDFATGLGDFRLYADGRRQEDRFRFLSAEGNTDFERAWDLDGRSTTFNVTPSLGMGEGGLGYSPAQGWWLEATGGRMETRRTLHSATSLNYSLDNLTDRWAFECTGPQPGATANLSTDILLSRETLAQSYPYAAPDMPAAIQEGTGLVRRSELSASIPLGRWTLGAVGDENLTDRAQFLTLAQSQPNAIPEIGQWLFGGGPTLSFKPWENITLSTGYREERERRGHRNAFGQVAWARQGSGGLELHQGETADWSITYTRRRRESVLPHELARLDSDLVNSTLNLRPFSAGLKLNLHYQLEGLAQPLYQEYFVVSDDRIGDYRRVPNPAGGGFLYVYDPGDPNAIYDRLVLATGQSEPLQYAQGGGNIEVIPAVWLAKGHWGRMFSVLWELNQLSRYPGRGLASAFFARSFAPSSRQGEAYQRVTLRVMPETSLWNFSPYYLVHRSLDRSLVSQEQWQKETEPGFNSNTNLIAWLNIDLSGYIRRYHRWTKEQGVIGTEDAIGTTQSGTFRPTTHPWDGWDLYLEGKFLRTKQTDRGEPTLVRGWEYAPGWAVPALGGRLTGEYRQIYNNYIGSLATRLVIAEVPGTTHRVTLGFSRAFGAHFSGAASYRGHLDPGQAWVHAGELTMAGYF